ncbi:T6SS effector BTH_I2691 family protein [Paraburkholderia kururiensis]|uniref:T6SS effector BTH_I2691 family protein n=2 Tax=Paraburkholderia kururiensis TaxID=984307 RepID=UPI000F88C565|nr:T6SS effector BTH_I2691 family protein [Paraburkholderia kururiensis]
MGTIPKVQAASTNARANTACQKSCNMCEKDGLLILPVRYAAGAATNAHGLGAAAALALPKGPFGDGVTNVSAKKATYFLRTVRKGFIHVYYASQNKWQIYGVTSEGYVFNHPLDVALPETQEKAFSCKQTGHKELAQCISIDHPHKAGKIYLAFSDVRWTAAVRKRYETNESGCRDHRMQSFDAAAWANGTHSQKHAQTIAHVADYVLEYKSGTDAAASASPFIFKNRAGEADGLKQVMDVHEKGNGVFFALWDPAGITQELNAEQIIAMGAAMKPYQRKMWVASAIEGLKTTVEEGAEENEKSAAEQLKGQAAEAYAIYSLFDGGKAYEKEVKSIDEQKDREMESVKTSAWKPYTEAYSPNAMAQFRKEMKTQMQQLEETLLNPLADDYVAWLNGTQMRTAFAWDYYEFDVAKGVNYAELFYSCIFGSTDRKVVYDLVLDWAQGDLMDRHNPLLRSMILNHNPSAEKVKEAAGFPLTELREPFAKLVELNNATNQVLEKEGEGLLARADKTVAALIHEVGGPIANFLAKAGDVASVRILVRCMSVRTRTTVIYKPVEGTTNQWISYMARQMYEQMPANRRPSLGSLNANLRKTFQGSSPQNGSIKVPQFIVFDANEAVEASSGATSLRGRGAAIFAPGVRAVLTEENINSSFLPKFRAITQGEVGYGVIGVIFNAINWMIASKELAKSSTLNRKENHDKFVAAIVSTCASTFQTVGNGMKAVGNIGLRSSKMLLTWGSVLEVAFRFVGAVAGLVGAWYDFQQAKTERQSGHAVLSWLYIESATANVLLCIATIAGATFLIFVLIIALIVIGILIAWLKHNEIEDWLSKCFFGTGPERFSEQDERRQFEALTS